MIRLHRVAQVRAGKYKEALSFMVKTCQYLKQNYDINAQAFSCRFGLPVGHVVMEVDLPNMGVLEQFLTALNEDNAHRMKLASLEGVFVEGGVKDLVLLPVDENDPVFAGSNP